mgnify:CR=1 FL=1
MKKNAKFIFRLVLLAAVVLLYFGAEALLPGDAQSTAAPQTQSAASQGTAVESTPDGAAGTAQNAIEAAQAEEQPAAAAAAIDEDGSYDTKDEVALYIHTYGRLPGNYITKAEAEKAGWSGGSVEKYCPGKCIGGGRFGNYEGLLPDAAGRVWTECDINTLGAASRGAERIVFSNDGLIYYTPDHYDSFQLLYGAEEAD